MKNYNKFFKVITALALMICISLTGSIFILSFAKNDVLKNVQFQADEIGESQYYGATIDVPQGKFSYNGVDYDAESITYYPSGNAFKLSTIELNEIGKYKVEYRAIIDNVLVKEYRYFYAYESLYSVGSTRSKMTYGKPSELNIPFTTEQSPSGLCVSLASGDTFTYNGVIDLNKSSKEAQAIKFYVTPQEYKATDVYNIYVKFTDIYDPTNYVIISVWAYSSKNYEESVCRAAYVTTCVPSIGQGYTAHYHTYQYNNGGWRDTIWKNMTTSGFCSFMSFYGDNANGDLYWTGAEGGSEFKMNWGYTGYQQLGFWWNYDNLQLYSNQPTPLFSELVSDYDDPNYYTSLWDGFETGECYVSLWGENYNNSTFNFVVTEVDGMDLSSTVPETTYKDVDKPQISVNYGKYNETNYPNAKVGCPYPVFTASSIDGYDGKTEVTSRAFYGYGTENCYEVTCVDTFTPDREGEFTIEYTAIDKTGNKSQKLVKVNATNTAPELILNTNINDALKTGTQGLFIDVANSTYSGGVGDLTYSVTATNSEGKVYQVENNTFRPMEIGEYTIVCKIKDAIGQEKQSSYIVNIIESQGPTFNEVPNLPSYLISGYDYNLPKSQATASNGNKVNAKIFLKDGTDKTEVIDGLLSVSGDTREVEIIYVATENGKTTEFAIKVPVVNVNTGVNIDGGKYFVGENFTVKSSSQEVLIKADEGKTTATANFINAVLADGFSAVHKITNGGFEEFSMYLTDSENTKEVVKFSWKNTSGTAYTYINDKISTLATMLDFGGVNESNFAWDNQTATLNDNTTKLSYQVNETLYGKAFKGFTSGKVLLRYEMIGIKDVAEISVSKICNQPIRTMRRDMIGPQVVLVGEKYVANSLVGDKIYLKNIVASDVLVPNVTATLTVEDPNGKFVKNNDGVELNQSLIMDGYFEITMKGIYKITYVVSDGKNEVEEVYTIKCDLENMVEITLKSDIMKECTVGAVVNVPDATFTLSTGEDTSNYKFYVLYLDPMGVIHNITSGKNFTATTSGIYKVVYTVYDDSGNSRTVYYDIICK